MKQKINKIQIILGTKLRDSNLASVLSCDSEAGEEDLWLLRTTEAFFSTERGPGQVMNIREPYVQRVPLEVMVVGGGAVGRDLR